MIRIVNGNGRSQHPQAIDEMFRLRKRVFHDFLKWDVKTEGDWEIDHYDKANPLYVMSYSPDTGKIRGSLRLFRRSVRICWTIRSRSCSGQSGNP